MTGTRPGDGLKEQIPVKCAGTRTEPPLSLPRPAADRPAAMAADSPRSIRQVSTPDPTD